MPPKEDRRKAVGAFRVRPSGVLEPGGPATEESICRRYRRHMAGVAVGRRGDVDLDADVRQVPKAPKRSSLVKVDRPSSLTFGGPPDDDEDDLD